MGLHFPANSVATNPTLDWNTFLGSWDYDGATGITLDESGNIYVTGYSYSIWGTPVNPYAGGSDVFVAKLDSNGSLVWNTFLGSSDNDFGNGITVDGSGNTYVTGNSDSTWGSPLNSFSGGSDVFVIKLNNNGERQWNNFLGSSDNDVGNGITVDGSGNTYVTGDSYSAWGTPLNSFSGGSDAFVIKLNTNGVRQWSTFLGSSNVDIGYGISIDGNGNTYVTGDSYATWGTPVNAFMGFTDAFVTKLNSSGVRQWNTFLVSSGNDGGSGITVDGSGNIYATGWSSATWGTPLNSFSGGSDAFVMKLNTNGVRQWNTFLGSSNNDFGYGITVDGSGNNYVTGYSNSTWGTPANPFAGGRDGFAAQLDSNGVRQWNTFMGTPRIDEEEHSDFAGSIATDGNGNVYVSGYSIDTWGTPVRPFTGASDAFVAKLASSDTTPPSVSWIAPVGDGQTYAVGNQTIQLEVNATDNIGVTQVVFSCWDYINLKDIEIGRVYGSPYRINFDTSTLLPGSNEVDVYAYDAAGNATSKYIWLNHIQTSQLTVNKTGTGSGTVTSSPTGINCGTTCSYSFAYNMVVTLTAIPVSPSTFGGWSGACSGMGTCSVTMNTAQSVTATFNLPGSQTLTVSKTGTGSGTVTSNPAGINCGTACSYAFAYNTVVTLTPTPISPSTFSGWSGACSGMGTCSVTMNAAQSVTATFNLPGNQTLTVSKSGTGSGTVTSNPAGIDCGSTCSHDFANNTIVTLTAAPISPSNFGGWSGACSGMGACTLTMDSAQSVTANFNSASLHQPVVFIPGIMGSNLYDNNNKLVWLDEDNLNPLSYTPIFLDSKGDLPSTACLLLHSAAECTLKTVNGSHGMIMYAPISNDSVYADLVTHFKDQGYIEGNKDIVGDFWVFNYDWRKDITLTTGGLDVYINGILSRTHATQVTILAHSMGGLVARQYISDSGRAAKVSQLITIGTPYLGTPKAFAVLQGLACAIDIKNIVCLPIRPVASALANTFPAFHELLPSQAYFTAKGSGFYSSYPTDDPIGNCQHCLDYGPTYQPNVATNINTNLFPIADDFHKKLDGHASLNNVPLTVIYGTGQQTIAGFLELNFFSFPSLTHTKIVMPRPSLNGDGTVTTLSATMGGLGANVAFRYFPDNHGGLVLDHNVFTYLDTVLGLTPLSSSPAGPRTASADPTGAEIRAVGVKAIDVSDAAGNHTGPQPGSDLTEESIPGSLYFSQNDLALVALLGGQNYIITITPTGIGPVDISLIRSTPSGTSATQLYTGIPASAESRIRLTGDPYQVNSWQLDVDGSGNQVQTVNPTLSYSGTASVDRTPPQASIHIQGTPGPQGWYTDPVTVTLSATDNAGGSGVNRIEYAFGNDRTPRLYTGPFSADPNRVSVLYVIATDKAGNRQINPTNARIGPERIYLPFILRNTHTSPALISPQNRAVLDTLIPLFEWDMSSQPANTSSCLAFSTSLNPTVCQAYGFASNGTHQIITWYNLSSNTTYYWRVGAVYDDDYAHPNWSEEWSFTTGPTGGNHSVIPNTAFSSKWQFHLS